MEGYQEKDMSESYKRSHNLTERTPNLRRTI
jgi:hypothetical protein